MGYCQDVSLDLIEAEIGGVVYREEFRPVCGFEKYYAVSSFGRLKKLAQPYKSTVGWRPDRIIMGSATGKGYVKYHLAVGGLKKTVSAHRLVAFHFLKLIPGKDQVNHKTGTKTDNHFSQLEWCTRAENNEHAVKMGLVKRGKKINPYIKKGYRLGVKSVINIQTGEEFEHVHALAEITGSGIKSLRRMLSGERYNYTPFRYKGEEDKCIFKPDKIEKKRVRVIGFKGDEVVCQYDNLDEISGKLRGNIKRHLAGLIGPISGIRYKQIDETGAIIPTCEFVSRRKVKESQNGIMPKGKPVIQLNLNRVVLNGYGSIAEAARAIGGDKKGLQKLLNGRDGKTFKGFLWEYA